ncbi:hypothetical protein GALMADRAFT_147125 [Galerina marginata CBS 339.88]|uniref:Uncharacterized protein n=1 Tax=Galerina marginata (strain CBS 339.88) TaxID=685588 RepID=A0A067S9S7_GALM3|nr:hypothetical protein GALMADRAFT_147125 [Galerina marginata CBS 339.88]
MLSDLLGTASEGLQTSRADRRQLGPGYPANRVGCGNGRKAHQRRSEVVDLVPQPPPLPLPLSPLAVPTPNGAKKQTIFRDYLHLDDIGLTSRAPPFLQDVGRLRRDLGGN